jgi:CBS domain-containing protein
MNRNTKKIKQGDRLLKMPGKLDRGPVDFQSHPPGKMGEIMNIATKDVISVPQTTTILGAVEEMNNHGFRRLPVTDAGTKKMRGIVTAGDIIDFMGGGSRFNLVQVKHHGNLIAALNDSVREIMTEAMIMLSTTSSFEDAVDIIVQKKVGGLPIIDDEGVLSGIVTERDAMKVLSTKQTDLVVEDIMTTSLRITTPDSAIGEATKEMVSHQFRRLPVVKDDVLFGIVTAMDVIHYIGGKKVFEKLVTGDVSEIMGLPVRTLINGNLFTITPEKNINEAALEMVERNVGALPVIEDARLVGLVTEFDLVKAFAER